MTIKKILIAALLVFVCAVFVSADEITLPQMADENVNDFAGVLTATDKTSIAAMLRQISQKAGAHVVVATVNSVDEYAPGYDSESFALAVFNGWKLEEKTGKGMLIFVSIKDRTVTIELGSDKSGFYDVMMQKVVKARMVPNFKEGDYGRGISDGVRTLSKILSNQSDITGYLSKYMYFIIAGVVLLVLVIIAVLIPKKSGKKPKAEINQETEQKKDVRVKEKKQEKHKKEPPDNFGGGAFGAW